MRVEQPENNRILEITEIPEVHGFFVDKITISVNHVGGGCYEGIVLDNLIIPAIVDALRKVDPKSVVG